MQERTARRNVAAQVADFALFSVGLAFCDPFVVLPAFVQELTGSELVVGALSAVRVLMIALPQVWAASVLTARPRKKPLLADSPETRLAEFEEAFGDLEKLNTEFLRFMRRVH